MQDKDLPWPSPTNEEVSLFLAKYIPESETERVFGSDALNDITPDFMGFVKTYYHLSMIIPKTCEVYDFGSGYNPQSYFFQNHARFVAISPPDTNYHFEYFKAPGTELERMTTKEWLEAHKDEIKPNSFAICNYVPNWYNQDSIALVKQYFRNVYTFYPA